ncbi:MAG: hypothetical protein HQM08_12625 [Candidatus Riflebacteria bacterium]|nr:hypothetical protein [Candidatus Riflebacteria bacterium]
MVEILLTLLVTGVALISLLMAFDTADELLFQSVFEERGSEYAERELEILKSDFAANRRKILDFTSKGRFRLPKGWKSEVSCKFDKIEQTVHLLCEVSCKSQKVNLESFFYVPKENKFVPSK